MRISDWSSDVCSSDLAPGLQLRDGGGAEGVAGGEHQAAALVLVASRQLADGGGLADAVDADGEDDERPRSGIDCQRFRSEEHTSELQSLMPISYAVSCLQKNTPNNQKQ